MTGKKCPHNLYPQETEPGGKHFSTGNKPMSSRNAANSQANHRFPQWPVEKFLPLDAATQHPSPMSFNREKEAI